jgi:hypothetical protein
MMTCKYFFKTFMLGRFIEMVATYTWVMYYSIIASAGGSGPSYREYSPDI